MGGNVFKGKTCRLGKDQYERVSSRVVDALRTLYPQGKVFAIPSYRTKSDFGDLDVLLSDGELRTQAQYECLQRLTADVFGAKEWKRNGPVISVDYRGVPLEAGKAFQVDMVKQDPRTYDYGLGYFSFNDLGNLIGRITHALGVSHRHDGLYWYFRDGTYLFKEIELTIDYDKALQFAGLDPARFAQGFEQLEDIFEYVASSEFFRPEIYLLHNRNHSGRIRNRKRKTYMSFLDWCERNCPSGKEPLPEDKQVWFERIQQFFPHFEDEYREVMRQYEQNRAAKEKLNGKLVSQLTGLTGPELGHAMRRIRASFVNDKAMIDFVLNSSETALRELILSQAQCSG